MAYVNIHCWGRWVPGAHWLTSLPISMSSRFTEKGWLIMEDAYHLLLVSTQKCTHISTPRFMYVHTNMDKKYHTRTHLLTCACENTHRERESDRQTDR